MYLNIFVHLNYIYFLITVKNNYSVKHYNNANCNTIKLKSFLNFKNDVICLI